jgi:hypothetical protein
LVGWLKGIRLAMKAAFSTPDAPYEYSPNCAVTDQGNVEILAITTVFPGIPIHYCIWHVLQVFRKQVIAMMTNIHGMLTPTEFNLHRKKVSRIAEMEGMFLVGIC